MSPIKPGYKTTEFWTTLLSVGLSSLVLSGKLHASDIDPLSNAIINFIGAAYGLYTVIIYIKGRSDLKKAQVQGQALDNISPVV